MCLPSKTDKSDSSAPGVRSIFGIGAVMLLACLGGPVLVGAIGAIAALVLCAAVPAIAVALRRRRSVS